MNTNTKKICSYCKSEIPLSAKKCPECHSDLRNWFVKHWIISTVLGLIILSIGLSATKQSDTQNSNKQATNSENIATTTEQKAKEYIEVFTFKGTGQKKSEPFTITGSRFKIAYDCKGDPRMVYCGAFLYQVGSKLPQGIMNAAQPIKDETIIYGSGEYYIDTNTTGNFTMTVYDYK